MSQLDQLAREYHAYVPTDSEFQRAARTLQSLWRQQNGFDCGLHRGKPLGSRLKMPDAQQTLANYLTEEIRQVVRQEVMDPQKRRDKVFQEPRIY